MRGVLPTDAVEVIRVIVPVKVETPEHRAIRLEKARVRGKVWYQANREKRLEGIRVYQAAHVQERKQWVKDWAENNPDKIKAKERRYREANRPAMRARSRDWYNRTKPHNRIRKQIFWASATPQQKAKKRAGLRAYAKRHPEKFQANSSKRRALKRSVTVNPNGIEKWITEVRLRPFCTCYYCHSTVTMIDLHFDHVVALKNGGPHCLSNLCISCATCNLSKGSKSLREFVKRGQLLLEL